MLVGGSDQSPLRRFVGGCALPRAFRRRAIYQREMTSDADPGGTPALKTHTVATPLAIAVTTPSESIVASPSGVVDHSTIPGANGLPY